jgi:anti-sigma B factor antagonist
MNLTATTREVGIVSVVDISGRIVLGEECTVLRQLVRDLVSHGHNKILLNLANVSYIDSAGLAVLISLSSTARKQHGEMKLVNLTEKLQGLMQVTRLYTVFDVMSDEAVAVKSFDQSASAKA